MSGEMELNDRRDNQRFQQREWRFQRVGWLIMMLLLVSAVLGLVGPGLFSYVTTGNENDPVRLSYHCFEHWNRESVMELTLAPAAVHDGLVRIWISGKLFQKIDVKQIHPAPTRTEIAGDRIVYDFAVSRAPAPLSVQISYEPSAVGMTKAQLGTGDYQVEFWQWIYP